MDAHPKVVNLAQALPEQAWKPLERLIFPRKRGLDSLFLS
jgi:hypothetical protein